MSSNLDDTHDPSARSWVPSANVAQADFPLQNLPFGVFAPPGGAPRIGIAIGDAVLDLSAATGRGLLDGVEPATRETLQEPALNALMALGRPRWTALRRALFTLLREDAPQRGETAACLHDAVSVRMLLPARVGDYTDFYASVHHAANVGAMMRPDQPLLPNYKWVPIGYHGRASSVVVSGTPVVRPSGQTRPQGSAAPLFGPTRRLDYEVEIGAFVGPGNELGTTIPVADAEAHVFGLCLLNDWSARDVQAWEYQPLGPFLAKSFATSVSPWIVTLDALAPFRAAAAVRADADPAPLPYLYDEANAREGAFDVTLEVHLGTDAMRRRETGPHRLSRSRFREMYWTLAQLVAHHASNGCNLRPGDLIGSGTVSGSTPDARGCLLELTWRGSSPITLPGGETRRFLEDGDEVIISGHCEAAGAVCIGFGECSGVVVAESV